jgi:hypothetical protein
MYLLKGLPILKMCLFRKLPILFLTSCNPFLILSIAEEKTGDCSDSILINRLAMQPIQSILTDLGEAKHYCRLGLKREIVPQY